MITDELLLIGAFMIIGLFTFTFRAVFLFHKPQLFTNEAFKNGLESVPSSLLVALVLPFALFVSGTFVPFRVQVASILLTIPIIYYVKKPGLSLPIALIIYLGLSYFLSIVL